MSRFRSLCCHAAGLIIGLSITAMLILLLDRREPLVLVGGSITPNEVQVGQTTLVSWDVEEHRNCGGELRRVIIDSANKVHEFAPEPTVYHDALSRDRRTFIRPLVIPAGVTPGPAVYTTVVRRWCNALQQHIWPIRSEGLRLPFVVRETR